MPTYLMLTSLTEKGTQTLNSNPARVREVNRDVEELGAKVLHQWASLGAYDFVNVVEAPDELTMANLSVKLGARGSVKFETLTLIPVDELLRRSRARASRSAGRGKAIAARRPTWRTPSAGVEPAPSRDRSRTKRHERGTKSAQTRDNLAIA